MHLRLTARGDGRIACLAGEKHMPGFLALRPSKTKTQPWPA